MGCAITQQSRGVERSGFLGDYSKLRPGMEGEAQLRLVAALGGMASGTAILVGKVGLEAELTDSLTGERLAAAVNERQGTKAIRGGIKKWSDVERAFDYWAERFRVRLAELRGS